MINPKSSRSLRNLLQLITHRDLSFRFSSSMLTSHHDRNPFRHFLSPDSFTLHKSHFSFSFMNIRGFHQAVHRPPKIPPTFPLPFASLPGYATTAHASAEAIQYCQIPQQSPQSGTDDDEVESEEEEYDYEYDDDDDDDWNIYDEFRDDYDGGGVDLQNCSWGRKVLSIAEDVSSELQSDLYIDAFETYPDGYIYVRVDRIFDEYGCPSMEDVEAFTHEYLKRLDKAIENGEIPSDLALEVEISKRGLVVVC